MIRKVLEARDPFLRKRAKKVTKIDKKILSLVEDLKDTLVVQKDPEGVGLAAPQIGKDLRIFVIKYGRVERVIINPEILMTEKLKNSKTQKLKKKEIMEGCLSLPNYYSPIKRNQRVKIQYQNERGEKVTEEFDDFYAQVVMHEIDHLNGILFVDRLLEQKKPLYKLSGKEWEEVELV